MLRAIARAGLEPKDIDLVNTHATGTPAGDVMECRALRQVFGDAIERVYVNNTKSFIGHCMGAAGALELAGNLPSFTDGIIHPTMNVDDLDPDCALPRLLIGAPERVDKVDTILNNSFGMVGINCVLIVSRCRP